MSCAHKESLFTSLRMPNKESGDKETEINMQQQTNKQIKNIKHKVEENVKY
jgi:hypothetical protein